MPKSPGLSPPPSAQSCRWLRVGDRLTDETGEWEIVGRLFTFGGGKVVHARVQKVGEATVTDSRSWSADDRVAVRRA